MPTKARYWLLPMNLSWVLVVVMLSMFHENVDGFEGLNVTEVYEEEKYGWINRPLMVGLTLIPEAAAKGADFYNWNRVKIRYCDGASFSGDSQNEEANLYFRGQRIWLAAMEELMSQGMRHANQALLSGCSAGGLATILHCDKFQALFPWNTRVKCLSDAGLFLDSVDVAGHRTMRRLFGSLVHLQVSFHNLWLRYVVNVQVWNVFLITKKLPPTLFSFPACRSYLDIQVCVHTNLQGVAPHLPRSCTSRFNPILCFFPQRIISSVQTPLFLVNAAYDSWQLQASLAPATADPHGHWYGCKLNNAHCSATQIQFLQGFRRQMLRVVNVFGRYRKNGYFINSCFAHCQIERQDTWFAPGSPHIGNKLRCSSHEHVGAGYQKGLQSQLGTGISIELTPRLLIALTLVIELATIWFSLIFKTQHLFFYVKKQKTVYETLESKKNMTVCLP
ncbi:hypothetical protein Cgig2_025089 [Carnegiea gigantea]|uniref:Pectin acetylesterase n=1 Tax=Carnegiea gigantea TaxID=171969 RepID=A0A9Q1QIQ7_9CARY|nr:hypothetical protein Cgig2_025089 [Carnegiea gigantea]